jgi:hypothetical protein
MITKVKPEEIIAKATVVAYKIAIAVEEIS